MNFYIVILQYNNFIDTKRCIDSLSKFKNENIQIIVVDNGSKIDNQKKLIRTYDKVERVHIILSDKNLGFSAGNNLGYQYALSKSSTDYIILLNNDTTITQMDFFEKISELYSNEKFAVCGPDIYNPILKKHQSPFFPSGSINNFFMTIIILKSIFEPILKYFRKDLNNSENWMSTSKNSCTHGACWIFSELYISNFPSGLDEDIFMYGEEILLSVTLRKSNLLQIYTPLIQVNHFEGGSTFLNHTTYLKRYIFKVSNEIKSFTKIKKKLKMFSNKY
ncbi:MAG: glycosyltransferase [Liquorilactobacillus sp.]|uniref:glycosyltransferase n=1 Tax=Liquorilactobacillus sp. TaxID=2767923 RepID=UPI0039EC8106